MFQKLSRILLPVFLAALLIPSALSWSVAAENIPDDGTGEQQSVIDVDPEPSPEPDTTYAEFETEYIAPETEYVAPETEYIEPQPDETQDVQSGAEEYVQPTTNYREEYVQLIDSAEEPTGFIAPQIDKSVSNKSYSTDYTAGIVSWICVGVGLIVIIVMLVSTKVMGARASQRRI